MGNNLTSISRIIYKGPFWNRKKIEERVWWDEGEYVVARDPNTGSYFLHDMKHGQAVVVSSIHKMYDNEIPQRNYFIKELFKVVKSLKEVNTPYLMVELGRGRLHYEEKEIK